jgi:hypothetical protein
MLSSSSVMNRPSSPCAVGTWQGFYSAWPLTAMGLTMSYITYSHRPIYVPTTYQSEVFKWNQPIGSGFHPPGRIISDSHLCAAALRRGERLGMPKSDVRARTREWLGVVDSCRSRPVIAPEIPASNPDIPDSWLTARKPPSVNRRIEALIGPHSLD